MCFSERNTTSRGRSGDPAILRRTRKWRRRRCASLVFALRIGLTLLRSGLAGLAPDFLAHVTDALALVGLGRPDIADLRGDQAHHLLVGALDLDLGRLVGRALDARRRLE